MYASKHLSELKANNQEAAASSQPLPEGPNSGYVVVKDDDSTTSCWGLSLLLGVRGLPIPQNKVLTVSYTTGAQFPATYMEMVVFVPVINLPLSANRYYAIVAQGKHKGKVHTCSKEEDLTTCCFGQLYINNVKPKPFDYRDIYQQIEIIPHSFGFTAKSVASDGIPPTIFTQKYWNLYENNSKNYEIGDAFGINNAIRSNFMKHDLAINVLVGKWYCPFIFLKDQGSELKDQMQRSCYYEVTLEQYWQEVHSKIENKRILLRGKKVTREKRESGDGFVWFIKTDNGERIGLSLALWERIKWEENRKGLKQGAHAVVKEVKFGSYVLVERFSFKRLNGSVALALEFIHTDEVRTK